MRQCWQLPTALFVGFLFVALVIYWVDIENSATSLRVEWVDVIAASAFSLGLVVFAAVSLIIDQQRAKRETFARNADFVRRCVGFADDVDRDLSHVLPTIEALFGAHTLAKFPKSGFRYWLGLDVEAWPDSYFDDDFKNAREVLTSAREMIGVRRLAVLALEAERVFGKESGEAFEKLLKKDVSEVIEELESPRFYGKFIANKEVT